MQGVRSEEGDTVDLVAFRYRGATAAVTEAIYKLNPGLAALGVFLPAGTLVLLPDRASGVAVVRAVKRIWS